MILSESNPTLCLWCFHADLWCFETIFTSHMPFKIDSDIDKVRFYLTRMLEDDHPASQAELFGNCPS